ncbi:nuclear transport factor 2 family protein [Pectobacterium brasiliense]|uniref:nuclear transport factor 2 family protein n=1 Tax=Pectobacterium brasiliense TaxID=180957 RepID=UPI0032EF5C2A
MHPIKETQTNPPHQAAQTGLKEWHRIIATQDWESITDLLSDDVIVHSPLPAESNKDKDNIAAILAARFSVIKNFKYMRHFSNHTGYVIEFSGKVGDDVIFGFDLVEFSGHGKITSLKMIMRPARMVVNLSTEHDTH